MPEVTTLATARCVCVGGGTTVVCVIFDPCSAVRFLALLVKLVHYNSAYLDEEVLIPLVQ